MPANSYFKVLLLIVLYHEMEIFSSNYQVCKRFLNVIFNTISIIYIFPEYPVKMNCHEHAFLCTVV